ncbi:MAG: hypothetical protein ACI4NG_03370 [Candidatus Gallimonas sp.]
MQEENIERASGEEERSAEAEKKEAPFALGKFASVDALVHAYEELESEFTRRSQRLKRLEEENKALAAKNEGGEGNSAAAWTESDSLYRAVNENEGVRARVLSDYLASLKGVPLMTEGGVGVTAPPPKAKTIADAGRMALGYFRDRNH